MITDAQRRANRANSQLSRGPVTAAGKASSSRNALRHGLQAQQVLLPGEDREVYQSFCEEFYRELDPVGIAETACVEQIISALWRLQRVAWFEAGMIRGQMYGEHVPPEPSLPTPPVPDMMDPADPYGLLSATERSRVNEAHRQAVEARDRGLRRAKHKQARAENHLGRAFAAVESQDGITKLLRYQTKLERSFRRAWQMLCELQATRSTRRPREMAVIDVAVTRAGMTAVDPGGPGAVDQGGPPTDFAERTHEGGEEAPPHSPAPDGSTGGASA